MRLGVICDGISRDLAHAVDVMDEFGLEHAELQFVGDTEVGDHSAQEIREIDRLLRDRGKPVSCLSRHVFAGLTTQDRPGGPAHAKHLDALRRVIDMAHVVNSPLVRIMTNRKEQILFGQGGAEVWNVAKGAWDATLPLIAPAVDLARDAGVTLVVETGNGTMVNSCWTARRLIEDLDAADALRILWDPANTLWCHEDPMEGLETGGRLIAHVHIKDVIADTPRATLSVVPMGEGQLGPRFGEMAAALRARGYEGVVSMESVHRPEGGSFEEGFRLWADRFRETFA